MRRRENPRFWACYNALPAAVRQLANRCYALLRQDPHHPSLHFKKVGRFDPCVSDGITGRFAVENGPDLVWFWIGTQAEYDRLIRGA